MAETKISKKYLNKFLNSLPLAICFVNPLGKIIETNTYFQELTGYSSLEIINKSIDFIILEKEKAEILKKEITEIKKEIRKEIKLLTKERKEILTDISGFAKKDKEGNFKGYFLAFSLEKEFQKKIEEEVKEKTKTLKESSLALLNILDDVEQSRFLAKRERDKTLAVIENFPEGLLFFSKENKLTSVNFKIQEIFGIKKKNLILGKTISELKNIPSFIPLINFLGEEINPIERKELELKKNLTLEVSSLPVISHGEKLGTLIILRDITREKIVERLKSEFVSIAAHQLRTPLSGIKWVLKMSLGGDLGPFSEEQRMFLEKTYQNNERMIRLINDLLNITRIEEGRILYQIKKENIIKIINEVINIFKEQNIIQKKNLKFEFIRPEKKIIVLADREKLFLALQNLIGNAFCYTPKGGEIKVGVKYLKNKKQVLVFVQDTGIGIPQDQQKRVFARFFRASNAIREETEGTGLGLYIAKNIIESHGGKIWFKSKENEGSTFYFLLAAKEE